MEIERNNPAPRPPLNRRPLGRPKPRMALDELMPPREWNFVQDLPQTTFHRGSSSRRPKWMLLVWSGFATTVDLLLSFSLACLFAWVVVMMAKVPPRQASAFIQHDFRWGFILSVAAFYACYLLVFRVFAGCTIGEWACGIRLGEPRHRISNDYSLRVIQRFVLVSLTGVVTLPILSLFIGDDMAGRLSGLPLVQHIYR